MPHCLLVLVVVAMKVDISMSSSGASGAALIPNGVPALACIMAMTNAFSDDRVEALVKRVQGRLAIKHVIPMCAFQMFKTEVRCAYARHVAKAPSSTPTERRRAKTLSPRYLEALIIVIKNTDRVWS